MGEDAATAVVAALIVLALAAAAIITLNVTSTLTLDHVSYP
jgi:hypothetical protein